MYILAAKSFHWGINFCERTLRPLSSHYFSHFSLLWFTTSFCVSPLTKADQTCWAGYSEGALWHYDTVMDHTSPSAKTLSHHTINSKALSVEAVSLCHQLCGCSLLWDAKPSCTKGNCRLCSSLCLLYRSCISEPQKNILLILIFKCVFMHLACLKTFIHISAPCSCLPQYVCSY